MDKFNEKIIHTLSQISIKFDELGFVPTTLNDENYEYFVDWFKDEVKTIREESSKQEKTITDLEAKLAESEKTIKYLKGIKRYDIGEMLTENAKLKQQLAEKEKEVAKWKNKKVKHLVDGLLVDRNLAIQIVEEIREDFRQKSFCNDYHEYIVDMEIFEYFNNKIKSLKGEK